MAGRRRGMARGAWLAMKRQLAVAKHEQTLDVPCASEEPHGVAGAEEG